MATFGLVVGAIYWFLTYEVAGTVLLTTFGFASGLAGVAVFIGTRRLGRGTAADKTEGGEVAVADAATEPVPRPGWAPLGIAVGLGGVALGAAFGPWLAIAGALLAIRSAKGWLDAAVRETDAARGRVPGTKQTAED
jgi:hypothetical protein